MLTISSFYMEREPRLVTHRFEEIQLTTENSILLPPYMATFVTQNNDE